MNNTEHERKYTIDLSKFYHWAQPYITRGIITTRIIKQWYVPEEFRKGGVMRIRQTFRGVGDVESVQLTIKVPTDDPAMRNEFTFQAMSGFDVAQFVEVLDLASHCIIKDRWDITRALVGIPHKARTAPPNIVVDFFGETDGSTTAILEIENPPADWVPPDFVLKDVTSDMSFTNFARVSHVFS